LKLFTKIKKLAKELELDTILMPDSDKEFPMAFTHSERSVFLILAPKMFDGNAEVRSFANNWNDKSNGESEAKKELVFTRDVLLKATKDDLAKACVERNELLERWNKLKTNFKAMLPSCHEILNIMQRMEELDKEGKA
jgi:hypothetical protein